MKLYTRLFLLSTIALSFSGVSLGQESEKKPAAKNITEKNAQADLIHAREQRKKQLKSDPERLTKYDTGSAEPKRSSTAARKKAKKKC